MSTSPAKYSEDLSEKFRSDDPPNNQEELQSLENAFGNRISLVSERCIAASCCGSGVQTCGVTFFGNFDCHEVQ
jgi:hypothetical protein